MKKISLLLLLFLGSLHAGNLKIISYNVLYGFNHGKTIQQGVEWIKGQAPDMIALQEMKGFDQKKFAKLAKTWGHEFSCLYKRKPGMPLAFSSKFPIAEVKELNEGVNRGFLLLKSGDIYFIVVHMTSQKLSARQTESAYIAKTIFKLLQERKRLVVLGDFNALSGLDQDYLSSKKVLLEQMRENPKKRANLNQNEFDTSILQGFYDLGLKDLCHEKLKGSETLKGSFPTMLLEKIASKEIQHDALQRIDFILTSSELADSLLSADIPKGGILEKVSDHYPLVIELDLK